MRGGKRGKYDEQENVGILKVDKETLRMKNKTKKKGKIFIASLIYSSIMNLGYENVLPNTFIVEILENVARTVLNRAQLSKRYHLKNLSFKLQTTVN